MGRTRPALAICLAAWAAPALALEEPSAAGSVAEVRADVRDGRMRSVDYSPGSVIQAVGRVGQTLLISFPVGMEISTFLSSDQDVMDGTIYQEEQTPQGQQGQQGAQPAQAGGANEQGVGGRATPCSMSTSMQVCIRNSRFLAIKPLIALTPQPLHVILVKPRGEQAPIEYAVLFEVETLPANGSTRVASNGPVSLPAPYYALNVAIRAETAPTRAATRSVSSPVARSAAPPRPSLARAQPQMVGPPSPTVANSAYSVQGDPSLVGAAR